VGQAGKGSAQKEGLAPDCSPGTCNSQQPLLAAEQRNGPPALAGVELSCRAARAWASPPPQAVEYSYFTINND